MSSAQQNMKGAAKAKLILGRAAREENIKKQVKKA